VYENEVFVGFRRRVNEIFALVGCLRSVSWEFVTDVSGQPFRVHLQGSSSLETSTRYQTTLRNIPDERRSPGVGPSIISVPQRCSFNGLKCV
jgi:hypothetical protein